MPTPAPSRRPPGLPALTGVRALAAVWVVLFHFRGTFESLAPWLTVADPVWRAGYLGVDLFFALIGFVLAYTGWRPGRGGRQLRSGATGLFVCGLRMWPPCTST